MRTIFYFALAAHLIIVLFGLYDLVTKSRRSNKLLWMFIIMIPVAGIYIYLSTRKRSNKRLF